MNHILPAVSLVLLTALIGCGPASTDCSEDAKFEAFVDADGDGYGDGENVTRVCAISEGVSAIDGDCDDSRADIYPRAIEVCDQLDNDCDGDADEALSLYAWYLDADGDGIGDTNFQIIACAAPPSYVAEKGDCDDADPLVTPGRLELCDGIDNDCDGRIDDDDTNLDPESADHYWHDNDGDGYGNPGFFRPGCEQPENTVANYDDCDDQDRDVHPGSVEICNDLVDDDCNGLADDDDPNLDVSTQSTWYADLDGDGYGDLNVALDTCEAPVGYVANSLDCDDADAQSRWKRQWIEDADGDGFGTGAPTAATCDPPAPDGWIPFNANAPLDCDDTTTAIHPARNDICGDGIDQDCSGEDMGCMSDTCAEALAEPARETGFHHISSTMTPYNNDISLLGGNVCTGTVSSGKDSIVRVRIQPGEILTAEMSSDADMQLILTSNCSNPATTSTCLAGINGVIGAGTEHLLYFNATASVKEAYVIAECSGADCGPYTLDIDISPAGSYFLPETCADAMSEVPITTGAYAFGGELTAAMGNDLDLAHFGPTCTNGYMTAGNDVFVPVEMQPGETLYAWYYQWTGDASVYIVSDCNNGATCLDGEDAGNPEEATYTNNTGAVQTVYVGLDCYSTYCATFGARLTID